MGQGNSNTSRPTIAARGAAPPRLPPPPASVDEVLHGRYLQRSAAQISIWAKYKTNKADERARVKLESLRRLRQTGRIGLELRRIALESKQKMHTLSQHPVHSLIAIGAGSVAGVAGFGATRLGTAFALQAMRISSANRIAATLGGAVGLTACTAVASHANVIVGTIVAEQQGMYDWPLRPIAPGQPLWLCFNTLLLVGSYAQFRLLGGRLRRFAPSDVMRRGSFAHKHIPAPSNDYADTRTKRLLAVSGGHHGCHSCGRSHSWWGVGPRLAFVGDHIPPNKYAKIADLASGAVTAPGMPRGIWTRLWPIKPKKTKQVFLPQCQRCSLIQSQAVRMDRRTLIFPRSWRLWDIWLPFPLFFALLLVPVVQAMQAMMAEETPRAERALGLRRRKRKADAS